MILKTLLLTTLLTPITTTTINTSLTHPWNYQNWQFVRQLMLDEEPKFTIECFDLKTKVMLNDSDYKYWYDLFMYGYINHIDQSTGKKAKYEAFGEVDKWLDDVAWAISVNYDYDKITEKWIDFDLYTHQFLLPWEHFTKTFNYFTNEKYKLFDAYMQGGKSKTEALQILASQTSSWKYAHSTYYLDIIDKCLLNR